MLTRGSMFILSVTNQLSTPEGAKVKYCFFLSYSNISISLRLTASVFNSMFMNSLAEAFW